VVVALVPAIFRASFIAGTNIVFLFSVRPEAGPRQGYNDCLLGCIFVAKPSLHLQVEKLVVAKTMFSNTFEVCNPNRHFASVFA